MLAKPMNKCSPKKVRGGRGRGVSVPVQNAIVSNYLEGMKQVDIARKFDLHRVTVSKVVSRFMREADLAENTKVSGDWKQALAERAVEAIEDGLKNRKEPYKRANLGVRVMKGLGHFNPESVNQVGFFAQVPDAWRERYTPPPEITAQVQEADDDES